MVFLFMFFAHCRNANKLYISVCCNIVEFRLEACVLAYGMRSLLQINTKEPNEYPFGHNHNTPIDRLHYLGFTSIGVLHRVHINWKLQCFCVYVDVLPELNVTARKVKCQNILNIQCKIQTSDGSLRTFWEMFLREFSNVLGNFIHF